MDAGNWINLFMALIATCSAVVTYSVYRSSTDPEVIVYANPDHKRPSIVNLIIKNIGKGPASDISFITCRPLPANAFSIDIPKEKPPEMTCGPLIVGIPYLAPNQELVITWGQFGGLKKFIGNTPITVTSVYHRQNGFVPKTRPLNSVSKLDIEVFGSTDSSDHNWGPKVVHTLKETNNELKSIKQSILSLTEAHEDQQTS